MVKSSQVANTGLCQFVDQFIINTLVIASLDRSWSDLFTN